MIKRILAVVAAVVAGVIAISILEGISSLFYRPDFDLSDKEKLAEYVRTLPVPAFLLVLAGHAVGAFAAAFVCEAIVRTNWRRAWFGLGIFFTLAGIMNLFMIPHPVWFMVVDLLVYIPCAVVGGLLAAKMFSGGATSVENQPEPSERFEIN